MAQKIYSIYNEQAIEGDQQLIVELGDTYAALVLGTASKVAGFEFYDANEDSLEDLLHYAKEHSHLLDSSYSDTMLFYNVKESVLVPVGQFNTSVAEEFLELAYGSSASARINVENVNVQPGIVNIYRSNESLQQLIGQSFRAVTKRHLISKLIESFTSDGLKVQFYKDAMIVVARRDEQLQLARCFDLITPQDTLYHLLNVCKQTAIDPEETTLWVAGFINTDESLFHLLKRYFGTVSLVAPAENILPQTELDKYPLHYFTPFLNLFS